MYTAAIDKAFVSLISKRAVHNELGITSGYARRLRYKLANGIYIYLDTKIKLLKKSGWKESDFRFTEKDLVDVVRFTLRQGTASKEHGSEYIVEKFLNKK
jgi:hypothetical protein